MAAGQFVLALIRLVRRGKPKQMILDNGPQFKHEKTAFKFDKAWKGLKCTHSALWWKKPLGKEVG